MTDRHVAYTVILDREIREDDAEKVVDLGTYLAVERALQDLSMDLWKFLQEWRKGKGEG